MRVCLDFQSAVAQMAGVGRYTRQLARHLALDAGGDELALFYFDFRGNGLPADIPGATPAAVRWCPGRVAQAAWKWLLWPPFDWLAGRASVYHFPNFILPPLQRGRAVVTIHDMSFVRHPEFAEERNLSFLRRHIQRSADRADAIITDSAFSAGEIGDLLKVEPARLNPIHLGIADDFRPPSEERVRAMRKRFGLTRPYLLSVGTLEPRKNHPFLIAAFERMTWFDGDLVIAGMPGWKHEPILHAMRNSARASAIRYLDYVPYPDLGALYGGAALFLFPSFYEGFGFPPLEAMACGTPVVAAAHASLPEVLGDAAALLDTSDPEAWSVGARRILESEAERRRLAQAGQRQAALYRWDRTAARTWEVYRKVAA